MLNRLRPAAGVLAFGLVAAGLAALGTHVAIDLVGDVALPHDTYDGLAHGSRGFAALGVVVCAIAIALRYIIAVLDGAVGRARPSRRIAVPRSPVWFVGAVSLAVVGLLVVMESVDSYVATGSIGTFADALGGSPILGLAIAIAVAATLGWLAWRALRWVAESGDFLARAIASIFAIDIAPAHRIVRGVVPARAPRMRSAAFFRTAAKRGPPLLLSV